MAKLSCQQHYHRLNYTKPPKKSEDGGRGERSERWRRVRMDEGEGKRKRESLTWREECEMGDSKVTVWERQMVTCLGEESVETTLVMGGRGGAREVGR